MPWKQEMSAQSYRAVAGDLFFDCFNMHNITHTHVTHSSSHQDGITFGSGSSTNYLMNCKTSDLEPKNVDFKAAGQCVHSSNAVLCAAEKSVRLCSALYNDRSARLAALSAGDTMIQPDPRSPLKMEHGMQFSTFLPHSSQLVTCPPCE